MTLLTLHLVVNWPVFTILYIIFKSFRRDLWRRRWTRVCFLQVHTRHHDCVSSTTTCNCAVAVREGNDILGIQACDRPTRIIRYLRDPRTPEGKANVKRQSDKSYMVGWFVFKIYGVCPSVISRRFTKTVKCGITQTAPHNSITTSVIC